MKASRIAECALRPSSGRPEALEGRIADWRGRAVRGCSPARGGDQSGSQQGDRGPASATFEPMVGTWLVAQDGADKVIMIRRPPVGGEQRQVRRSCSWRRRGKLYGNEQPKS